MRTPIEDEWLPKVCCWRKSRLGHLCFQCSIVCGSSIHGGHIGHQALERYLQNMIRDAYLLKHDWNGEPMAAQWQESACQYNWRFSVLSTQPVEHRHTGETAINVQFRIAQEAVFLYKLRLRIRALKITSKGHLSMLEFNNGKLGWIEEIFNFAGGHWRLLLKRAISAF